MSEWFEKRAPIRDKFMALFWAHMALVTAAGLGTALAQLHALPSPASLAKVADSYGFRFPLLTCCCVAAPEGQLCIQAHLAVGRRKLKHGLYARDGLSVHTHLRERFTKDGVGREPRKREVHVVGK